MPIYEYRCAECQLIFEKLRPMSKADMSAPCIHCGSSQTSRAISLFSAISKGGNGESRAISGAGSGCGSCAGTQCATCSN
jgi:putative FmdB family regulatory protein